MIKIDYDRVRRQILKRYNDTVRDAVREKNHALEAVKIVYELSTGINKRDGVEKRRKTMQDKKK